MPIFPEKAAPQVLISHQGNQTARSASQPCSLLCLRLERWCGKLSGNRSLGPGSVLKMLPASFQRASQGLPQQSSINSLQTHWQIKRPKCRGFITDLAPSAWGNLPKLFSLSPSFIPLLSLAKDINTYIASGMKGWGRGGLGRGWLEMFIL